MMKKTAGAAIKGLLLTLTALLGGCGVGEQGHRGTNVMEDSDLIAIYERDSYDEVIIANRKGKDVGHYILVERGDSIPAEAADKKAEIIRVPAASVATDSEVYAGMMEELGAAELISGMLDAGYVTSSTLKERIKKGEIADFGNPSQPNTEKMISAAPDAILISYYDGMQTEGIEKTGIPVVKMYDLQETTPLGRAEWIKLAGRLAGRSEKADSIYEAVKSAYLEIGKEKGTEPKVLTEIMYEGSWDVAGGDSYQARLIEDAGGNYFKKGTKGKVALHLSPEQVLTEGGDADIWLIRYFGGEDELREILRSDPVYGEIKAYKEGNIYFSDTSESGLFREFPVHPELLLEDYRIIFSGDTTATPRYFRKLDLKK